MKTPIVLSCLCRIVSLLVVLLSVLQLVIPISSQELAIFSMYGAGWVLFWNLYRKIWNKKENYVLSACCLACFMLLGIWKREWIVELYQDFSKEMWLCLLIPWFVLLGIILEHKIFILTPFAVVFLLFAAIKEFPIHKAGIVAILYLLFFSLIEYEGLWFYGKEGRKKVSSFFLLPFALCLCLSVLPISEKPYPFTALKQAWKQIQEGASSLYTEFSLFVTNQSSDFIVQFTGYSEDGLVGGSLLSSNKPALFIQILTGSYGNLYLAGNIQNHYERNTWSFTGEEKNLLLEQELQIDVLEFLYALYQLGYTDEEAAYLKQAEATLTYQGMYTKDMFFPHKIYDFRNIEDYKSLGNKVIALHPLKEGDSYRFRYIVLNYGSDKLEQLIKQREGTNYQADLIDNTGFTAYIVQNYPKLKGNVPKTGFEAILSERAGQIYKDYMQVPEEIQEEIGALAREITAGASTDYERLKQIEAYLQKYHYTLTPPIPEKDAVMEFLFQTKEGYCTYFSSAFVLLSRAAGIPARYVNGFFVPLYAEEKQEYMIGSDLAHTWPEAYIAGIGWISFEPTASFSEYHNTPWEYKPEIKTPKPERDQPVVEEAQEKLEWEQEEQEDTSLPVIKEITYFIGKIGLVCIGLFPFLFCGFCIFRLGCRKKSYLDAREKEKVAKLFAYELVLLKGLGIGHRAEETLKQYKERLLCTKPQLREARLSQVFDIYMESYYGGKEPKEEERKEIIFCIKETEKYYQGIKKVQIIFWKCFT